MLPRKRAEPLDARASPLLSPVLRGPCPKPSLPSNLLTKKLGWGRKQCPNCEQHVSNPPPQPPSVLSFCFLCVVWGHGACSSRQLVQVNEAHSDMCRRLAVEWASENSFGLSWAFSLSGFFLLMALDLDPSNPNVMSLPRHPPPALQCPSLTLSPSLRSRDARLLPS